MPFTDARGRSWPLTINVNTVRRVKAACGVDLLSLVNLSAEGVTCDLLDRLAGDPCLLVDVLFELVRPSADDLHVSPEAFAEALDGDALEGATVALLEAVIDFFPAAKRKALKAMLDASRRFAQKQNEALDNLLQSPALSEALDKVLTPSGD
jgi:hypothetical protein